MTDTEITQTDVLTLMRTYDPPPDGFDPHTAPGECLRDSLLRTSTDDHRRTQGGAYRRRKLERRVRIEHPRQIEPRDERRSGSAADCENEALGHENRSRPSVVQRRGEHDGSAAVDSRRPVPREELDVRIEIRNRNTERP